MKRHGISLFVAPFAVLATLGLLSSAIAGDGDKFRARLRSIEEPPAISSVARGAFEARLSQDGVTVDYTLTYQDLEGDVRQAHIHLGQRSVNGGISVWLCQTAFNVDPTGLAPACPQSGTVEGSFTAANVIGPAGQGIATGEFAELIRAMRAGVTYANVHSTKFPGGEIRGQIRGGDDD
ncbi:MAG TPA: CHRD domain-containing protein [Candidatus Methylomirabilis sp.]|nr:CHRD domain-containing protein [Candidatus Methylomirabilis sp.]